MRIKIEKVVVITGAANGLGKEIASQYLDKGYSVVATDLDEKNLRTLQTKGAAIVSGDLTKSVIRKQIVDAVLKKHGRIDILMNNAGITYIQPFADNTEKQIRQLFEIDLIAPMILTRMFWDMMVTQKSGHVININSTAGKEGKENHTIYCAAKYALRGFSDALRIEAKKNNIRVTSVHPGGIATPFYRNLSNPPDMSSYMNPRDVAKAIVALSETKGLCPDELVLTRI